MIDQHIEQKDPVMNTFRLILGILTGILVLTVLFGAEAQAQNDQGFIYGKVTTIEDESYIGQIRWGKEEAYWTDLFNASKDENKNIEYLSRSELDGIKNGRNNGSGWKGMIKGNLSISWNEDNDFIHQFSCQFGEIKTIKMTGRNDAKLTLQSGLKIYVEGDGYNDLGTKIVVLDKELGEIELNWSRVAEVEFMSTPNKLDERMGNALYGTVETSKGTFTGFVQWDHDERIATDKLDGDNDDADLSIEFGKIRSIENLGSSSRVVLNSGRALTLRGSNDVNGGNRGIIVTDKKFGRVDIEWNEFEKVTFSTAKSSGEPYSSFAKQNKLEGTVKTVKGETLKGQIVYDLDEEYDFELLQGMDDALEYSIPFREIKRIAPKNYNYSTIYLKNGEKLLLGDAQDVNDRNTGLLVFTGKSDPIYLAWRDVEEVNFN